MLNASYLFKVHINDLISELMGINRITEILDLNPDLRICKYDSTWFLAVNSSDPLCLVNANL
jgi:hypothetical protein